jgi:hypothetical protein
MRITPLFCSAIILIAVSFAGHAETVQSLQATIDGKAFVSDDESITLIPVSGSFTLVALTAGASDWPPPKTPVDRLAIFCDDYEEGQTLVLDSEDFDRSACDVTFTVGHRGMGEASDAEYRLDKSFEGNRFEITSVRDKTIMGRFAFQMKDEAGRILSITDGRFLAEDQQY